MIDLSTDDLGAQRLAKAQAINALVADVVRKVATLHAVRADVVRNPRSVGRKPHIVMARSHACWLLKQHGLTDGEIGRALKMTRPNALRSVRRWDDHRAGLLKTVTEGQVWAVKAKVEGGMSIPEACKEVGVGATRYEARLTMMREEGKLS